MRLRSGWTRPRCCCTHRISLLEALPPDSTGMSLAGLVVVVVGAAVAGGAVVVVGAADASPDPSPPHPTTASATARVSAANPPVLRVRFRARKLPARSSALDRSPKADLFRARLTTDESLEPITLESPGYLLSRS